MSQTAAVVCDLWLHVSDKLDTDDQELHNYFRQASVNLEQTLKNPGVWDPFILSYIEVSTRAPPTRFNYMNMYLYNHVIKLNRAVS